MSEPTRQRGDQHWTRRAPERILRGPAAPGAKLSPDGIERTTREFENGANQTWLARKYGVSRYTVWRHVRKSRT